MYPSGIKQERETVIVLNESDSTASIWTTSGVVYRRLKKLGYFPSEDNERSACFEIPKRDIRLPRPKRAMSKAQRQVLATARAKTHVSSSDGPAGARDKRCKMLEGYLGIPPEEIIA